ncbi:hypothetical protein ABFX02_05G028800 [Erythranthe guttata]
MLMAFNSSHLSVFFTFLFFLLAVVIPHSSAAADHYLKLPLLHKNHYPPTSPESLSADNRRLSTLLSAIGGKRSHAQLPLHSAASFGSGQYLVSLHLGTPPQRLLLVADTGSDLTWVSCSACRSNCTPRAAVSFFPRQSATFSPHHCYSPACTLIPHPKKAPHCNHTRLHSTCRYEYSYSDGSVTSGFFSHETTAFNTSAGKLLKFRPLSFGCGFSNSGPSVSGPSFNGANGVMGLGRGPISFSSQLGRQFGHKFSYCLMDYTLSPPPTSYLLIGGGGSAAAKPKLSYTPLLQNPLSPTFYYIGIENVIVNDTKLPISPSVWAIDESGNGGTVVDSGTTLTFLAEPAYKKILAVFERLVKLPTLSEPIPGFDLCLNVSDGGGPPGTSLPQLSFQLAGGSVFSPPPRNYFIDAAEDVKCLALQPVASAAGFSVIGNLMQQGYTFEFDKDRARLGFTRRGCAVP